jgi:hypothetical protein
MRYGTIILVVVIVQSVATYAQSRTTLTLPDNPFDELVPVDFCEVVHNPRRYDGKVIRMRAIFDQQLEMAALLAYDSKSCPSESMRPDYDCATDSQCANLRRRIRGSRNGQPMGRGAVLIKGRFIYRKLLTYGDFRLGIRKYEFRISKVEEVLNLAFKQTTNGSDSNYHQFDVIPPFMLSNR